MTQAHPPITVQTLADFALAWNRHDLPALMAFMHEDCIFHAVAGPDLLGKTFAGRDAVEQGFRAAWEACPDAAWLDGEHVVCGDRGITESTFVGTQANGQRIHARMVDVFTFKDGKILVKNAFRKNRPLQPAAS